MVALSQALAGSVNNGLYNYSPFKMQKWRKALANTRCGLADAKMIAVGDSTDRGEGSASDATRALKGPVPQLAALINGKDGLVASAENIIGVGGWSPITNYDNRITLGGAWVQTGTDSVGGRTFSSTGAGTLSFAPTTQCDKFDVYWMRVSGTPSFDVAFNGGGSVQTISSGLTGVYKTTITTTLGANTINLIWGAGTVYIAGIDAWNSATKVVHCLNAGISGGGVAQWTDVGSGQPWNPLTALQNVYQPDLSVICLGINDWRNSVAVSTYSTKLGLIVDAALVTGSAMIKVPQWDNGSAGLSASQQDYVDAMYAMALAKDIPLYDVRKRWGTWAQGNAVGFYASGPDNVHGSQIGYSDIARGQWNAVVGEL